MKPFQELLDIVARIDNDKTVAKICMISSEYVESWKPRKRILPDKREIIEPGWEPSGGFIAAAMTHLRTVYPQF